jgi:hypothetical protein
LDTVRRSTAALLHSLEKDKPDGQAARLLRDEEVPVLRKLAAARQRLEERDRRCHYCELFYGTRSDDTKTRIPIVVTHAAHVEANFDPATNISRAEIRKYTLLVPASVALRAVAYAHPLNWPKGAPKLFKSCNGVAGPVHGSLRKVLPADWLGSIVSDGTARIEENTTFQWNEVASLDVDNIITIRQNEGDDSLGDARLLSEELEANGRQRLKLAYRYFLDDCIAVNLGLGPQHGGIDVDCGIYEGKAQDALTIENADVSHLTPRDVYLLTHPESVDDDVPPVRRVDEPDEARKAVLARAREAQEIWGEAAWLLTVTASKQLRFTAPGITPVDLWATLTWMAPALLFTFIHQAVCMAPEEDIGAWIRKRGPVAPPRGNQQSEPPHAPRYAERRT